MGPQELSPHYTWTAARAAGLSARHIGDDGVRITRGAYVSRAIPLSVREACVSAAAVLPPEAAFSHLTAAALFDAPVRHSWPLALTLPPGVYRPRRRRVRVHVRDLLPDDVTRHRGLSVTSGPQTWLDLAGVLAPEELVASGTPCSETDTWMPFLCRRGWTGQPGCAASWRTVGARRC